jgi:hypothetical protein
LITKKYVRFDPSRVNSEVFNEFAAPPLGKVNTGKPLIVEAYVIDDDAFVTVFTNPLLSATEVTLPSINVTVRLSAGSIHN